MTVQRFYTRLGKSVDLGSYSAPFAATGTTARVRVGLPGSPARLQLVSSPAPALGLCAWTIAGDGLSATLAVDLHQTQIDAIGVGEWVVEFDAIRSTGEILAIATAELIIRAAILPPA